MNDQSKDRTVDVERDTLILEREKVELERAKLEVERHRAKWTAIGVGIPIVVAAGTVMFGVWSQYQKGRDDFALKASEILMAGDNPGTTQNKAKALSMLFPSLLPRDFAKSFDVNVFPTSEPDNLTPRKELLDLMSSRPADAERILAFWKAMFPDDKWLRDFEIQLKADPSFQHAASIRH